MLFLCNQSLLSLVLSLIQKVDLHTFKIPITEKNEKKNSQFSNQFQDTMENGITH